MESILYIDILESQGGLVERFRGPNLELSRKLNLDVSTEEFLSAERAFSYADCMPCWETELRLCG
jgi:hypothetical protein